MLTRFIQFVCTHRRSYKTTSFEKEKSIAQMYPRTNNGPHELSLSWLFKQDWYLSLIWCRKVFLMCHKVMWYKIKRHFPLKVFEKLWLYGYVKITLIIVFSLNEVILKITTTKILIRNSVRFRWGIKYLDSYA